MRRQWPAVALAALGVFALVHVATPLPAAAANGLFLWTDKGGLMHPMLFPPNEKCFDTFNAAGAHNHTDSDAVLSRDGLCSDFLQVVKPGESAEVEFGSVGFTPPGAVGGS
jgi:hypothetical protein